jgi:formimidoylglutamate deiminase
VNDCLAWCGKRPVQWLMENLPVNDRFHLVHATHLDEKELFDLSDTGATVVLCPSTEGNLGDGIFRMKEFCKQGGHWTIGTDSHIGLDPVEELRMIDYRQRLITHQRNTFPEDASHYMIQEAIVRGQLSSGTRSNENFEKGKILNAVIYDASSPLLENSSRDNWLSTLVFAPGASRVYGTICRGQWQVKDGHHKNYEPIKKRFSKALEEISTR